MKKIMRRILAIVCVLALTMSAYRGENFEAKATTEYTEYTFKDFGLADQDVTGKQIYSETVPYGTSLDKVSISGMITFPEGAATGSENIQIGNLCVIGPSSDKQLGVWNIPGSGWFGWSAEASESLIGKALAIRLAFDVSGSDYTMKIEIDGQDMGTVTLANGVSLLTWHSLLFNAGAGKTVSIASPGDENVEYVEYSYADFHIADQEVTGQQIYSEDVPYGTSLDKVSITGKITFPEGAQLGSENVQIGNLCVIGVDGDKKIGVWNIQGASYFGQSKETTESLIGRAIELKLSFLQSGSDYDMKIEVDGEDLGMVQLKDAVNLLTWHALMFNAGPEKTIILGEKKQEQEKTYLELNFADFGIEDKTYKSGTLVYGAPAEITTLDGIAVTGTVAFSDSSSCIRIGGSDAEGYRTPINILNSAGSLWSWDEVGTNHHVQIGEVETGKAVELRVTFDYEGEDVVVGFWLNDVLMTEYTYTDYATRFGISLLIWARGDDLVVGENAEIVPEGPIEQKTPQELGYKQIRLADFALADSKYSPEHKNGNHHFDVCNEKSLSKTYLDVNLSFADADNAIRENSIRYASEDGWSGVQIGMETGQLIIQNALTGIGHTYTTEDAKVTTFAEEFNLKLGITIGVEDADGKCDVIYDLWVNDVRIAAAEVLQKVEGLGNGLGIYTPSKAVTISSPLSIYGSNENEKKEKLDKSFRTITFHNFGIKNGTYKYTGSLCTSGEYVLSLDKTIFSGDVLFSSIKGGDFRYGGKSNEWCGLWFYNLPDGKLYMQGVEGETGIYVFKSFIAGVELTDNKFNIKLSTEYVDSDKDGKKDDVKLGVWFNDVLYDNAYIYLKDYAQYLGNFMGIYVDESEGYISVSSDKSVEKGIDFTLFGLEKKTWKERLGL